jgi:hypothetical protein
MIPGMKKRIPQLLVALLIAGTCLFGADVTGIWTGTQQGRRGEAEDVSFRFRVEGTNLTGKMFGDEFDLPIEEATLVGDQVRFAVITKNYYSGTNTKFIYSGTVTGSGMTLVRERIQTPEEKAANKPVVTQTLKLKRL